jgi:fatty acid desaturase 2 (delta-6 desaturase)
MHEGGHYSLTGNIKLDRHLQMFTYGVGCGMSGSFWRNQHNKHHATPQKVGHDVDLRTMPLVAFHKEVAYNSKGKLLGNKLWAKHQVGPAIRFQVNSLLMASTVFQAKLFAPVICELVSLGWQFFLHPRFAIRTKNFTELAWMASRYLFIYSYFGT